MLMDLKVYLSSVASVQKISYEISFKSFCISLVVVFQIADVSLPCVEMPQSQCLQCVSAEQRSQAGYFTFTNIWR